MGTSRIRESKIERLELRQLLAAAGPAGYGYTADATAFENIDLVPGQAGVFDGRGIFTGSLLGDNTFNFYGHVYGSGSDVTVFEQGLIRFGAQPTGHFNPHYHNQLKGNFP